MLWLIRRKKAKCLGSLTIVRHGISDLNAFKINEKDYSIHGRFHRAKENQNMQRVRVLAEVIANDPRYNHGGDSEIKLSDDFRVLAYETGKEMRKEFSSLFDPTFFDVIVTSTAIRSLQTKEEFKRGWPELQKVRTIKDERLCECNQGLLNLYNNKEVFFELYPEQKKLYKKLGPLWYAFPNGESIINKTSACRGLLFELTLSSPGENIILFTHSYPVLCLRSIIEPDFDGKKFIETSKTDSPKNCSVTHYKYDPNADMGRGGLVLKFYNRDFFKKK